MKSTAVSFALTVMLAGSWLWWADGDYARAAFYMAIAIQFTVIRLDFNRVFRDGGKV